MQRAIKCLLIRLLLDPACSLLSREQLDLCTTQTTIQCVIFLFSSLCLLRLRHKDCVEHPKAICFNKMAQFVYKLIVKPDSRAMFDCYYS